MPRNSNVPAWKDPTVIVRAVLGTLLAANLVAAGLVMFPPGGSADELEREMGTLQSQLAQNKTLLERTRQHAGAVEKGKADGDKFLKEYFLDHRTVNSHLQAALNEAAAASKIKPREAQFNIEPIEGSDTLSMVSMTVDLEGNYRNVLNFVHEIDKSSRLLIIESLNATPQQGTDALAVQMKIDAFMREDQAE